MSLYTTEVRYICERAAGYDESQGFKSVNKIIRSVWDKVIPQEWEIFDESYRSVLCQKILKHYYTREIGLETVGLWQLKLETKLNEIMPYYNELYKTVLFKFNPLYETDYFVEHTGKDSGTNTERGTRNDSSEESGESLSNGTNNVNRNFSESGEVDKTNSNTGTQWNLFSDTPQGTLNLVDQQEYLTDARKITNNDSGTEHQENERSGESEDTATNSASGSYSTEKSATTSDTKNGEFNNTNEYVNHVYGKMSQVSYMKLVKEFRENLLNIDMMVIDDLKDLFMLLWR